MPVKGVTKVKSNMKRIITDISEKKAVQFVNATLDIGANASKEFTAIEFGKLINSQYKDINIATNLVSGSLGFVADYAVYLEFNEDWKPKPASQKEGNGYNPNARPHFLRDGFESQESQAAINKARDIFKL